MKRIPVSAVERVKRFGGDVARLHVVGDVVRKLNSSGEAYLFGGGARDACFGRSRQVNDLDIVVSGKIDINEPFFCDLEVRRTNFGGYRLNAGCFEMDLWQLDKSLAFVRNPHLSVGISSLLNTVCFTTDSIAMSLSSGEVYASSAFIKSIAERTIGFVARPEGLEPLVAARAIRLLVKLNLLPEADVAAYIRECAESFGVACLISQEGRWKGIQYLNRMSVDAVLSRISGRLRFIG
ncbi:hypothetical protein [Xanthomonas graminis]|uniref:hypothetical protein n=1 Tax=Xanthomonas graminis TaxID=3390026 RepID=UPI000A417AA5|nr:hypothetical protein [Xanthomonas translucens]